MVGRPRVIRSCAVSRGRSGPETISPRFTIISAPRRPISASTASKARRFPWMSETAAILMRPKPSTPGHGQRRHSASIFDEGALSFAAYLHFHFDPLELHILLRRQADGLPIGVIRRGTRRFGVLAL